MNKGVRHFPEQRELDGFDRTMLRQVVVKISARHQSHLDAARSSITSSVGERLEFGPHFRRIQLLIVSN